MAEKDKSGQVILMETIPTLLKKGKVTVPYDDSRKNRDSWLVDTKFSAVVGGLIKHGDKKKGHSKVDKKSKLKAGQQGLLKTRWALVNQNVYSQGRKVTRQNLEMKVPVENEVNYPIRYVLDAQGVPDRELSKLEKIYPTVAVKKYSTTAIDPNRSCLTVFEYSLNNQSIMWDYQSGFVHLTSIWKATFNDESHGKTKHSKADIVKLLESTPPEYHQFVKRIRGGFLKIQGTWLAYGLCKTLASRFCFYIRYDLIPIFGHDFPQICLRPTDEGFGKLKLDEIDNKLRRTVQGHRNSNVNDLMRQGIVDSRNTVRNASMSQKGDGTTSSRFHGIPSIVNPLYQHRSPTSYTNVSQTNAHHVAPRLPIDFDNQFRPTVASVVSKPYIGDLTLMESQLPKYDELLSLQSPLRNGITDKQKSLPSLQRNPLNYATSEPFYHMQLSLLRNIESTPPKTKPLLPPLQLATPYSPSSNYVSLPISYSDMVDILNASKCLQSLSQKRSSFDTPRKFNPSPEKGSVDEHSSGVSSILFAANVNEDSKPRPGVLR